MNFSPKNMILTLSALSIALTLVACEESPDAMLISAKSYLKKNDSNAAIIQLKNALQRHPDLPEARFLLGVALFERGDPVGSETEFRKAIDLKYPNETVVPMLARALLAQGHAKKLTDEMSSIALVQPAAKASLLMSLTTAYAMQGKAELSRAALSAALQADPENPAALIEQARQKAVSGDLDAAQAQLALVIAKYPANYDAWRLKGDVLLHSPNQMSDALVAYQKSVEIKPDFLAGHTAIITIYMQQGNLTGAEKQIGLLKQSAATHPQTHYLEAQLAYQKKDYKLAGELVQLVLKAAPDGVQGLQLAGAIALQLNSLAQAEIYLGKAVQAAPELLLARRALIYTYLKLGQPAKALLILAPGLNRKPVDPELLVVAGEVYLQNGNPHKAEEYFLKASQQSPDDATKRTKLALARLEGGATESAFNELQDIAKSDKGISADMALISANLKRKALDKALKAIDGLEKKQPDKPLSAQLRAKTLLAKNDVAGAKKSFELALTRDPTYFPAVASLAALDMEDKNPEQAKKRLESVLSQDPKNGLALLGLAEIADKSGASKAEVSRLLGNAVLALPADAIPRLLLIELNLRNKDPKGALSVAQNAVSALPENPVLLDALGRVQQSLGEFNQAATTYNKLAVIQVTSPLPHIRLAEIHLVEKNKDAATQSLYKALELKPDQLDAQRALIVLDMDSGKFQNALTTAHTVQLQRPGEVVGYALEGDINAAQKNWSRAVAAYQEGLKRVNSSELAIKLHAVMQASGRKVEAEKLATTWLKENPKDASFLFYLGDLALSRHDYVSAEKSYFSVIRLQVNNAVAYNNLAWVSSKLNKESALSYAIKANELAPNQPAFMDTLAILLSEKGDYAKALEYQNKALALQPKNSALKLNLAKIYLKGGQKVLARKELDELAKLGREYPEQAEVLSLLKVL